ncbi:hypothetical protein [Saccharomonospora cyanea]|nr:hypothetical protein [Saccharomonospora cyanea]
MEHTFKSVSNQAQAWHQAANSVEPVPPVPEKPNWWDNVTSLGGASDTYEQQLGRHAAAAARNVEVMSAYEAETASNQSFPRSYTTLSSAGGSITIDSGTASSGVINIGSSSVPEARGGVSATSGPGVSTGAAPMVSGVPSVGRPGPGGIGSPAPTPTPPVGPSAPTPTPVAGGGPVGTPPVGDTRRNPNRSANSRPGTGPGRGGAGERAGSRLYGARPAAGGGTASGGAAGRLGDATAAKGGSLGAPRVTGTGAVPGAAPAGGAAAAGTAGGAGARGAGMAPMGAAGGRGQGDEDKEHQRASYLQENDPDEAFIGDLGKTAPPVIGQ